MNREEYTLALLEELKEIERACEPLAKFLDLHDTDAKEDAIVHTSEKCGAVRLYLSDLRAIRNTVSSVKNKHLRRASMALKLNKFHELLSRATPGPWNGDALGGKYAWETWVSPIQSVFDGRMSLADAEFIAFCRNELPEILAELTSESESTPTEQSS